MSGDYLWDRSGEPNPEIQHLEEVLGGLRSNRPAPNWSGQQKVRQIPGRWAGFQETRRFVRATESRAAIAAGVALVICASWVVTRPVRTGWQVARMEGAPMVGKSRIWAPPRMFSVETPAAVAVDLGCRYSLKVDDAGITTLHVMLGWVGFEQNGHESWVPEGAECVTRPGKQAGTPYFVDASETFRTALARFDFDHDAAALDSVLAEARNRDAMTLWHLLPRVHGAERVRVYDRLAHLAPPPANIAREAVLGGDQQALDLWWDQLGLGESSFWRMWKGASPFQGK